NGLLVMAAITALSGVASIGAGVMTAEWSFAAVAAVLALFGFTAVGWNGVAIAEVARSAPPGEVGTATGGVLFYTFAGVLAGPAGGGRHGHRRRAVLHLRRGLGRPRRLRLPLRLPRQLRDQLSAARAGRGGPLRHAAGSGPAPGHTRGSGAMTAKRRLLIAAH